MHRSVNNWVYLRPKVGMQQYITIWIDGKGIAISSKLHSTKGNGEIIQKPHISESNTRHLQRHAHSVCRCLLFDFVDCNVYSHDSKDELVLYAEDIKQL